MGKAQADKSDREKGGGGYPYHLLPAALKLGEAVKNNGGRDVQRAVLAGELQMAEAGFNQLCASAKTFGIVEGSRSLSLTEGGHDYFFPTNLTSERVAMLGFFAAPSVFKALIDDFDGSRLPTANLLANVLHRKHSVPQSWAARAASIFLGTAAAVSVVDASGFLRYGAATHTAGKGSPVSASPYQQVEEVVLPTGAMNGTASMGFGATGTLTSAQPQANVWTYKEAGGAVRMETSDPLPLPLWERLKKYVEMLKPASASNFNNTDGTNEETSKRDG